MDTTTQLIGLCLDLYAKLETMQENKEECEDVQLRLKAIEEFLKDMQSKKNNANDNGVLDYLEKQLVFAQKIIESQQRKKSCIDPIVLFFCADKYKADLEKVNQRLSEAINQLNLPNTKVLLDIQQQLEKQANMRSPKTQKIIRQQLSNKKQGHLSKSGIIQPDQQNGTDHLSTYEIKYGDSLFVIALNHGLELQQVIDANPQISNPNLIYPGEKIFLPLK